MRRIRKGDEIIVLAGKDKGKRGTVLRVDPRELTVLIEGINKIKRHQKPNPMKGQGGGIVERELPLHMSNVALFNSTLEKADRVSFKDIDGRKVRCFRSSNEPLDA